MNYDFLSLPYDPTQWKNFIRALFASEADLFAISTPIKDIDKERIESFTQFGTLRLGDMADTQLALFEIKLKPNTTKLHINRVALRQIVLQIKDPLLSGALAVFVDDEKGKWRFSFIAKTSRYDADGALQTWETEPKRYTYVFGDGEKTKTAEQRFKLLETKSGKTLKDIAEAFSVEKINREFFDQYKKHYDACWQYLARPDSSAYSTFKINQRLADDKARKPLRDFAKRLMGRLVFLYFLQKKGWMGCSVNREDWTQGDPDFTANLFRSLPETEQNLFYSKYLTRLFFNTLNERRPHDQFLLPDGTIVRVPYLNGGLFDGDVPGTEQFDLPAEWFVKLFDFFGQYNFTIDESAPNDQEIGIDPEMLGHIFESLLEENREKGAYYTPKEIVHYMCQESLLLYLKERLGLLSQGGISSNQYNIIWGDSRAADERDLEVFVRHKRSDYRHNFIHRNARLFEKLLNEVRICDPAIGSGAFPMGLLHEIFHCLIELDLTAHPGKLKKDIIHHCIYGVDKDKGAVDIARLRFWLALVVDEDLPQPLPNLDFKIMQGDSLLESFEGIDLSNLLGEISNGKNTASSQKELFAVVEEPSVQFGEKDKAKLAKWIDQFFEPDNSDEKADLQVKIDNLIEKELNEAIRRYKMSLFTELSNQKSALAREQELKRPGIKQQKEIARLETEIAACESKQEQLAWWQEREEKPFLLWHTWFREVFDRGGFDIVIGNPPYVQLQRLGRYSDTLETQGFETFVRTGDLYCLFYEKAIKSLRTGGVMAYITSNSWLKTLYGEPLRRYFIENSTPVAILNFENTQLFKSAIVETNILLALKGHRNLVARAVTLGSDADASIPLHKQLTDKGVDLSGLSEREWIIGNVMGVRLKMLMEEDAIKLIDIKSNSINYGIKTSYNEAFILNKEIKDMLISIDFKNSNIIKPILRGRDVQKYSFIFENLWIINSHNGIRNLNIPRVDIVNDYPAVLEHFKKYQDQLIKRQDKGEHWTNLRDCAYLNDFDKPKIIWGELSNQPKFTYDDKGYYLNNTMFMMTGERLKYILAILNSKAGEWYFNQISTTSGMGTNRWLKYKIEQLPIPAATPEQEATLERLVEYMLWLKEKQLAGSSPDLQVRIDYTDQIINGLVYELYFPQSFKQANMTLFEHLGDLPPLQEGKQEQIIEAVFQRLSHKEHPLRNNLFYLRTIEEVKTIMEGLKSSKHTLETMLGIDYEETDHEN